MLTGPPGAGRPQLPGSWPTPFRPAFICPPTTSGTSSARGAIAPYLPEATRQNGRVYSLHQQFTRLGALESHVLDSSRLDPDGTAAAVLHGINRLPHRPTQVPTWREFVRLEAEIALPALFTSRHQRQVNPSSVNAALSDTD